jgi:hypothetical protein
MQRLELRVDEVIVETEDERTDPARLRELPALLQRAFQLFADKLQSQPLALFGDGDARALERLRVDRLGIETLLGPAGVEQLADELYRQLVEGIR